MHDFRTPMIGLCAAILVQAAPVQAGGLPLPERFEQHDRAGDRDVQRLRDAHHRDHDLLIVPCNGIMVIDQIEIHQGLPYFFRFFRIDTETFYLHS